MRVRRWFAAFAMLVAAAGAGAATDLTDVDAAMRRVENGKAGAYRAVLGDYDRVVRERPRDGALAAARCEFIGRYADVATVGDPSEQDLERCQQDLRESFAVVPEARVVLYVQGADLPDTDDEIAHGDTLLAQSQAWPQALRCKLLDAVATRIEDYPKSRRPGELAVELVRLCNDKLRVVDAFTHLVRQGLAQPAADLLDKAPPNASNWQAERRIKAALAHPDRELARRELERLRAAGAEIGAVTQARVLMRAGDAQGAASALRDIEPSLFRKQDPNGDLRFSIATETGDALAAASVVGLSGAATSRALMVQLERYQTVVAMRPSLALSAPLLPYTGALLGVAVLLLLLPGLVLVPAHYRGLIRRARGRLATPLFASVGLTRAWIALVIVLLVPLAIAGLMSTASGKISLSLLFWSSVAQIALLAPWTVQLGRDAWFGTLGWRRASRHVLACWGVLLVVMVVQGIVLVALGGADTQTAQTRAVAEVMSDGIRTYGTVGTLLVIAVLAPMVEELVFRGFLLGGLTRHLGFGTSNVVQAAMFAAFHGDPPRLLFYLAVGLLAGWLVRRGGGLASALALHALNNALFTLLFLAAT